MSIEFYQQQLPAHADASRQNAMQKFLQVGWPTRKLEAWKYTRPQFLQEKNFAVDGSPAFEFSQQQPIKRLSEISVQDSSEALINLNHALWTEGAAIHIPAGEKLSQPLQITIKAPAENQARFLKLNIFLEKNASAEIVLNYENSREAFISLVVETQLQQDAQLKLVQQCQADAMHYVHHQVQQAANSHFQSLDLTLKTKWFRQDLNISLQAEHATCAVKGIYLGKDKEHIDHHLCIKHEAPHCQSEQFFKGILTDQAKAVFNGKVIVAKGAKKTNAKQKNDSILLSAQAEVDTKPELEIYNDDVTCSHGATVGELSTEALFYLVSRGISEVAAKNMLLAAFVKEVLGEYSESMTSLISERLQTF
jgi:Fe-S cluster assembly protein SufD